MPKIQSFLQWLQSKTKKLTNYRLTKKKEKIYIKNFKLRNSSWNIDSKNDISPDEYDSSSTYQSKSSSTSYSPYINFGCNDSCCKTVNVLTKSVNVLTKQEEQEELFLEAISKINDPELKAQYLKKLRKLLTKEETDKHNLP